MSVLLGESALSFHGAESQLMSLLIFIFTGVAAQVLVLSGSQVDTFLILLIALVIWIMIRNALEALADATQVYHKGIESGLLVVSEDEGWSESWSTGMDFVSRILILLTFQVAGALVLREWTIVGVTTQETLVLLFLVAVVFFPVFLWIHRTWVAHNQRIRESLQHHGQKRVINIRNAATAAGGHWKETRVSPAFGVSNRGEDRANCRYITHKKTDFFPP